MNGNFLATVLILVTNFRPCQSKRYDNYSLYSVFPNVTIHLTVLQNLERQNNLDVIFWKRPSKLFEVAQLIVNPRDKEDFLGRVRQHGMFVKEMLSNVQAAFDSQTVRENQRLNDDSFNWDYYHTLKDIEQWLYDIAQRYPTIAKVEKIGKSVQGRDILAIIIKRRKSTEKVFVEGGIHGHEWISIEFVTYLIYQLIHTSEMLNNVLREIANHFQWYLVPVVNPDGFFHTHAVDRLWRKNVWRNGSEFGVDLNRNFDYAFGKHGSSNIPSDDTYSGPSAFSEPETRALSSYIKKNSRHLKFYFSIHSYGQKLIIPYGDEIYYIDNYHEMKFLSSTAVDKIKDRYGVLYSYGTFYDTFGYKISGTSSDWVKKTLKIKYVLTIILRDNGTYGYALPNNQIQPTCEEAVTGILNLILIQHRQFRAGLMLSARGTSLHRVWSLACVVSVVMTCSL